MGSRLTVSQALPRERGTFQRGCVERFSVELEAGRELGDVLAIKVGRGQGGEGGGEGGLAIKVWRGRGAGGEGGLAIKVGGRARVGGGAGHQGGGRGASRGGG